MQKEISLDVFLQSMQQKQIDLHSVLVYQEGREETAYYADKWGARWRENRYSLAKSVTTLGVGLAIEEGLMSLEDRPLDYFPELIEGEPTDWQRQVTLRHLLTMTAGYGQQALMPSFSRDQIPNWTRNVVNAPVVVQPGSVFSYNNGSPYLCSAMVTKRTGQVLTDYLKPRLFEPLGIHNPQWLTSPEGCSAGSGGLLLTPWEMMQIGKLYLQEGQWEGRQLISADWIREATKKQVETARPDAAGANKAAGGRADSDAGYGYLVWRNSENRGYRAIGNGSQFIFVFPEKRAVLVLTARENWVQKVMDAVWEHLYPQL